MVERDSGDKPFRRAGIQEDGSVIQEISHVSVNQEGKKGKYPPDPGQRIITRSGPFEVEKVVEMIQVGKKLYFRAIGDLVPLPEDETY